MRQMRQPVHRLFFILALLLPGTVHGSDALPANVLRANTGVSQEEIDLYWNDFDSGCLRAFFLNGDCDDEMENEDGVPTDVSFTSGVGGYGLSGYGQAANFRRPDCRVGCGSKADIDNLATFSISAWVYVKGGDQDTFGRIVEKEPGGWQLRVQKVISGKAAFTGRVSYSGVYASSSTFRWYCVNEWHHIAMTYDHNGDRRVHIFLDGEESPYSPSPVRGQGVRCDDSGATMTIGNSQAGNRPFPGCIDDLRLYRRVLSQDEIAMLAHEDFMVAHSPMVSFTFDDGNKTVCTNAKPVFDAWGEVGTVFMTTGIIGQERRLTAEQLQALQNDGWEIGSHSKYHPWLTTLTDEEIEAELSGSKAALEALGLTVRNFAYPYGDENIRVRRLCRFYYRSGRATYLRSQPIPDQITPRYHTYAIKCVPGDTEPLPTLQSWVDDAQAKGCWLVFLFHDVTSDKADKISSLIQYIKAKSIRILTVDQALDCVEHSFRVWREAGLSLYGGGAVELKNRNRGEGSVKRYFQNRLLAAGDYVVSCLAYKDGSPVTSSDMEMYRCGIGPVTFAGTGTNDMKSGGKYTGAGDRSYRVEIDGSGVPDTFKWSEDGGSTWAKTKVSITKRAQPLSNGVTVTFDTASGHRLTDRWDFLAYSSPIATTYEPLERGIYLAWGTFTAAAGLWDIGVEVKPLGLVHVALLTCYRKPSAPFLRIINMGLNSGDGVTLEWDSLRGLEYEVQFGDGLMTATGKWLACADRLRGNGERLVWNDNGGASRLSPCDPSVRHRYYRIRLPPFVLSSE